MNQDEVDDFFAAVGSPAEQRLAGARLRDDEYLRGFAARLQRLRQRGRMTRRMLADQAGVSERYLGRIEDGTGNVSLLVLRALAAALAVTPLDLLEERPERPLDRLLARLDEAELAEAHALLARHFSIRQASVRKGRIALVGLQGAGKTALGERLAAARGVPFVELDRAVETLAGLSVRDIFERVGQVGYRRLQRQALEQVLRRETTAVIAAGSGLATAPASFNLLLRSCRTIWLKATPEAHLRRLGLDEQDVPGRRARAEYEALLATRGRLFARADAELDTSAMTLEAAGAALAALAG